MIGADPEGFVRYLLDHQSAQGAVFRDDSVADYLACAQDPSTVRAWCEDYRAGWTLDRTNDEADRGRTLDMPLLVLWGESGSLRGQDGRALWRPWAKDVSGTVLPCGHFIPEEQPDAVIDHFRRFFGTATDR